MRPSPGAVNVHPNPTIVVAFSEPMDPATTVSEVTLRRDPDDPNSKVEVDQTVYNAATGSVRIIPDTSPTNPNQVLQSKGKYFIVVEKKATDANGLSLGARFVSSFTVADYAAPVPTKREPGPNDTNVSAQAKVEVTFSEELKPDTVSGSSVFLRDAAGLRVPAVVELSSDKTIVTLTPRSPLALSTTTRPRSPTRSRTRATTRSPSWNGRSSPACASPTSPTSGCGSSASASKRRSSATTRRSTRRCRSTTTSAALTRTRRTGTTRSARSGSTRRETSLGGDSVYLDREVQDLEPKSWTVFETETGAASFYVSAVSAHSVADYGLSGRASRLQLSKPDGTSPSEGTATPADFHVRETAAHVRSEELELGRAPDRPRTSRPATRRSRSTGWSSGSRAAG